MITENIYNPNPLMLSKSGINLTFFHPDADVTAFLLYRAVLERASIQRSFSYYVSEHPGFGLLYLKSGSLLLTALSSMACVSLSERGLFLLDCRSICQINIPDTAEYELLRFNGPSQQYFYRYLPEVTPFRIILPAISSVSEYLPLFEATAGNPVLCNMLLTKLLSQLTLPKTIPAKSAPFYLNAIKAELEAHYYKKFTLDDLEHRYEINKYCLCREFKNSFHSSPMQYLHQVRMQAARKLLAETDMKIHEISYEIGYENVNHFIGHFKKAASMTPTQYRLSVR